MKVEANQLWGCHWISPWRNENAGFTDNKLNMITLEQCLSAAVTAMEVTSHITNTRWLTQNIKSVTMTLSTWIWGLRARNCILMLTILWYLKFGSHLSALKKSKSFFIQGFWTIVFIVIFTTFWLMCPPAFFKYFLSNSGAYPELWTKSFIQSTGVACFRQLDPGTSVKYYSIATCLQAGLNPQPPDDVH